MTAYLELPFNGGGATGGARADGTRSGAFLSFAEFRQMLRRRLRLIFAVTAIGLVLGAVTLLLLAPQYTATAILLVDPRQQRVTQSDAVLPGIGNDMGAVESQVELVQSTTLARKVIGELHLDQDPEFVEISAIGGVLERLRAVLGAPPADAMQRALSRYAQNLQVRRRGLTYVLEVGFVSKDADKAARIANAAADAYLSSQVNVKLNATSQAAGWLGERLTELRQKANAAERAVADYKAAHQLVGTGDRRTLIEQQIADLNGQLTQARVYASDVQARFDQMRKVSAIAVAAGGLPEALQSQVILSLRTQYAQTEKTVADLSQSLGPLHPSIRAAQAELVAARSQIAAELGRIAAGLRNQLAAARGREHALDLSMSALKQTSAETDQANVRLRELEREAEANRTVLQQFLVRYRETSEQQNFQVPDARIVSPASPPLRPSFPNPAILMALAAVLSVAAGIGSAVVAERFARKFRSVREAERLLALPVVGLVPRIGPRDPGRLRRFARSRTAATKATSAKATSPKTTSAKRRFARPRTAATAPESLGRFAIARPLSLFGDALKKLAQQLQPAETDQSQVIVVTSALAGEGVSTIAENLAHVLARSGTSTLLIDAGTDQPRSLATCVTSLLRWLRQGDLPTGFLERDSDSGLYTLSADVVEGPSDTAGSGTSKGAIETVVRLLRRKFDHVVIDGGPLLGSAFGGQLLPAADVALLVIAWRDTDRRVVVDALELAGAGADKLQGVVLNKVEREAFHVEDQASTQMVA